MTDRTEYFKQYRRRNRSRRNAYQRNYRAKQSGRQPELIPSKKPGECDCRDYRHCMQCRNAEKRRAFRAGEIPAYRLALMEKGQNANDHQL